MGRKKSWYTNDPTSLSYKGLVIARSHEALQYCRWTARRLSSGNVKIDHALVTALVEP